MKPWLKELFLLLADGVELHKHGAILMYDDPEILVANEGYELYCGGDLEEALAIFNAAQPQRALDEVHAERTMSMSCPSCHRLIEVVVLASLRQ